jgi:hypothetical protein
MVQKTCGYIAHVHATAPQCISSHRIIHCLGTDVKKILNALNVVSDDAGKIINFIKSRPLNS